jgi:clan AA aspartic protease
VLGPNGRQEEIDALIDTGFDGWLTVPLELVARLDLPWRRRGRALLADGSQTLFDIYEADVLWDKRRRRISVDEVKAMPLVGMSLLDGFELKMQVRKRGKVTIRPLK